MDFQTAIAVILGSSVISSIITIVLRAVLVSRVDKANKKEIERLKAALALKVETEVEITGLKLEAFPEISSLVYRCRNIARDLANNPLQAPTSLVVEYGARVEELIELLYKHRLVLEGEGIFLRIHAYKNLLQAFGLIVSSMRISLDAGSNDEMLAEIRETYKSIDNNYNQLVSILTIQTDVNSR